MTSREKPAKRLSWKSSSTTKATNINFLIDGPATQKRNKTMFYFLANELHEFYPKIKNLNKIN